MKKYKDIVVMGEFSSSGIWKKGLKSFASVMIDPKDLNLPDSLIKEFYSWINFYDKIFYPVAIGKKKKALIKDVNNFNKKGLQLAKKLKTLFPKINIWYCKETYTCQSHELEII